MLYVLLGLAAIEVPIVHLLVSLWSTATAYVLVALSLLAIVQIVAIIRRVKRGAAMITSEVVKVLSAKGFEFALPWRDVAAIESLGFGPAPAGDEVLGAALLAHPNIAISSVAPFTVRKLGRSIHASAVTLRLDDPDGFVAAARSAMAIGDMASAAGE